VRRCTARSTTSYCHPARRDGRRVCPGGEWPGTLAPSGRGPLRPMRAAAVLAAAADVRAAADDLAAAQHEQTAARTTTPSRACSPARTPCASTQNLDRCTGVAACLGSWSATDLTVPEPRGVVLALTPWNDPVAVACGLLGAALVTGNTVVHKPSERAALVGELLTDVIARHLPRGVLVHVRGPGEAVRG